MPDEVITTPNPADEAFVYEYQPKDADGRPLGGKQVIKARDMQGALDKMANQSQELIRLNRKMKQDQALGIQPESIDQIPADAERDFGSDYDFTPKQLTPEERLQLSMDMNDSDRIEAVAEKFSEVLFGQKPEKVREMLKRTSHDAIVMRSYQEASAFREAHPEFHNSMDNTKVLVSILQKEGLAPTKRNFELVYTRAQKAGLLVDAPEVAEDIQEETHPGDGTTSRITGEPSQQTRLNVTSTGHKGRGSNGGTTATRTVKYTKADIDKMSADEYRQKVYLPEVRRQQATRR